MSIAETNDPRRRPLSPSHPALQPPFQETHRPSSDSMHSRPASAASPGAGAGPATLASDDASAAGLLALIRMVCAAYRIGPSRLLDHRRAARALRPAYHDVIYLARVHLDMPAAAIARALSRDATLVCHVCRRIEMDRDDPETDRRLDALAAGIDALLAAGQAANPLPSQSSTETDMTISKARLSRTTVITEDGEALTLEVDLGESPLGWLRSRKDKSGQPLIDDAAFAAGERFRRDFTVAGLEYRTTMNWEALASGGLAHRSAGQHDALTVGEAAMAARKRLSGAIEAVGPDLGDVLLDVCAFLKPLTEVERQRGWPARSAKLMLLTALNALARHYRLRPATPAGHSRSGNSIRHWGTSDYRPKP
ncbi:chromosomal replication initiator protein DnaA [Hartmannibacter diazotrophicus]|uniref:Chromosomal replication initiator protein DnaA n=1 Tax=Hartmannibacter diazotrophicus TaxID=1482074 RepID=A0A2C9D3M1_9HYPH|nr:DUF6456 domain-containing protein [Hartmannibacter diazotrophicus]SON54866.1 chromosomal replication initiator protein DnaA [Hartmannibacter diazotrophicus]